MRIIILAITMLFVGDVSAQSDTILYFKLDTFFHTNWVESTEKDADFYRPLPLEKVGELYQLKDYFINGDLQMEGFVTDPNGIYPYAGKAIWYYKNGKKKLVEHYQNGERHGQAISYFDDGSLNTDGIFENGKEINGTFENCCPYKTIEQRANGKRIEESRFYKNSKIIAERNLYDEDEKIYKTITYDKQGIQIGEVTVEFYQQYINGRRIFFNIDNDRDILSLGGSAYYKDGILEGESIDYDHDGELMASGIYKNGKFFEIGNYAIEDLYEHSVKAQSSIKKDNETALIGKFKNGQPDNGTFMETDGKKKVKEITMLEYKNGKKHGLEKRIRLKKNRTISSKEYQEGQLVKESWLRIKNEAGQPIEGVYKNGIPFQGDFFLTNEKVKMQLHYENGVRVGNQLTVINRDDSSGELETINYKNGKPFEGTELKYEEDCYQKQLYKNGILQTIVVDVNDPYPPMAEAIITFADDGFTTEVFDYAGNKRVKNNHLVYSNNKKTSGSVDFFEGQKSTGKLLFVNNKITELNFDFNVSAYNIKMSLSKEGTLTSMFIGSEVTLKFNPIFEFPTPLTYIDLISLQRVLLSQDGSGRFYLKGIEEAVADIKIKNGKQYEGASIRYDSDTQTYFYEKFEAGEEVDEQDGISREALLKLLGK